MIYIGGLGHSGTTLVHFIVGAHPQCIALGEIWGLIRSPKAVASATTSRCSCGQLAPQCPFWGGVIADLAGDGDYRPVLDRVRALYGDRIAVDSSKHPDAVQPGARLLFCIRDVRGWAISMDRVNPKGFLSWYRRNQMDRRRLERYGPVLTVSYDELALNPVASVRRMCEFLGLEYHEDMITGYGRAEHHAIKCNRMKGDRAKMAAIRYDYRWFNQRQVLIPSVLLPQVMQFNEEQVYGLVDDMFALRARPDRKSRRVNLGVS